MVKNPQLLKEESNSENVNKNPISDCLRRVRPHIVKRCFITGKQCIFSSLISENKLEKLEDKDIDIFVIMPYKPNFETFFQWGLKPFLTKLSISEDNIRKANDFTDMGYIVCEKICKKIQESTLIIADISVANVNVFYELGLAYGLERPILLIQEEKPLFNLIEDPRILNTLSYGDEHEAKIKDKIFKYHDINKIVGTKEQIAASIFVPVVEKKPSPENAKKLLQISLLNFSLRPSDIPQRPDDILLTFNQIIVGSINSAMNQIKSNMIEQKNKPVQEWKKIQHNLGLQSDNSDIHRTRIVNLYDSSTFTSFAQQIESSFCTIIDVSPESPDNILAYFWLGYCHSRGLNVIPVFRLKSEKDLPDAGKKIAFDVRSLWFADYYEDKPYQFKDRIQDILEHFLLQDFPDLQKRKFWKRFPLENELKVIIGAIHNNSLNREVVGDWDVRTVSELFSYLPLVRETSMPMLVPPFYSPEQAYTIFKKKDEKITRQEFIEKFNNGIALQLKNANAIVIASPDVNPVCEFLLNKIYEVSSNYRQYEPLDPFTEWIEEPEFNDGYILVKERKAEEKDRKDDEKRTGSGTPGPDQFKRLFSREKIVSIDKKNVKRGFQLHHGTVVSREVFEPYYAQDEYIKDVRSRVEKSLTGEIPEDKNADKNPEREFYLIGHLLIAKYPPEENGNYVIVLNGVSGPATYALAQILTGGVLDSPNGEFAAMSEELLKDINWRLDAGGDVIGVQGLVKVHIVFDESHLNMDSNVNVDIRKVKSWEWYEGSPHRIFKRKKFPNNKLENSPA